MLKPVKNNDAAALVQADANGSKNLVPDSLEKNSIKDAPEYCQSEATIKTPKQKKNGKRKFKKKRMKSPPSELDKELKDLKEETDDVVFRNRTKFTVTHSDVTFDNVAGNNGESVSNWKGCCEIVFFFESLIVCYVFAG